MSGTHPGAGGEVVDGVARRSLSDRVRTVVFAAPPVLAAVWAGGPWLAGLLALTGGLCFPEVRRLTPQRSPATMGVIVLLLGHLWLLRGLGHVGPVGALGLIGVVWASDIAQFSVGRRWGRHRLAPVTSPGKSVEGLAGGLAAAALVGVAGGAAVGLGRAIAALLAVAVAAAGVAGDLTESHLKRRAGVKDSGSLLPGHGGVLDRIDSLLFAAPVAYWLLRLAGVG